jgi:hypothetical protein
VFLAAIEGAATEIGMEDVIDLDSLSREFLFVKFGRWAGGFISQHYHVEVGRLESAITRRMGGRGPSRSRMLRGRTERPTESRKSSNRSARRSRAAGDDGRSAASDESNKGCCGAVGANGVGNGGDDGSNV